MERGRAGSRAQSNQYEQGEQKPTVTSVLELGIGGGWREEVEKS